jgi:pimeloyl-ACP methyl ester carboxylesterase
MQFTGHDKPPIVLVRGWIGQNSDFDSVNDALAYAGYDIRYADIESTWDYTPSIFKNVDRLIEAIDLAKQETGQSQVILVAHSMGGIISRAYTEGSRYRGDVAHLFTFGSPHWGTPISADLLVGLLALAGTPPAAIPQVMIEICSSNAAICELSHAGMAGFNLFHRPRGDVAYHFVGGAVPLWKVYIFKLFGFIPIPIWYPAWDEFNFQTWLLAHFIPGPDDGFIPTDSSLGRFLPHINDRLKTPHETHNSKYQAYGKLNSRDYFSHYGGLSDGYWRCLKPVLVDKISSTCR